MKNGFEIGKSRTTVDSMIKKMKKRDELFSHPIIDGNGNFRVGDAITNFGGNCLAYYPEFYEWLIIRSTNFGIMSSGMIIQSATGS